MIQKYQIFICCFDGEADIHIFLSSLCFSFDFNGTFVKVLAMQTPFWSVIVFKLIHDVSK